MDQEQQDRIGTTVANLKNHLNTVESQISNGQIDSVDWNELSAKVGALTSVIPGYHQVHASVANTVNSCAIPPHEIHHLDLDDEATPNLDGIPTRAYRTS